MLCCCHTILAQPSTQEVHASKMTELLQAHTESMESQHCLGHRQSLHARRWYDRISPCGRAWLCREKQSEAHSHRRQRHHRHWLERVAPLATRRSKTASAGRALPSISSTRRSRPSVDRATRFHQHFVGTQHSYDWEMSGYPLQTHPWKIALPGRMILPYVVV